MTRDLDEYLQQTIEPKDADSDGFVVDTLDKAMWASYKARDAVREIDRIKAWKKHHIAAIEKAAEENLTEPTNQLERMKGLLAGYVIRMRREGRKKKSLALPGGKISLHKRQPEITFDEKELLPRLKEGGHREFVKVEESVDATKLKKALKRIEGGVVLASTGEVIEGVDLAQPEDSVSFKPTDE